MIILLRICIFIQIILVSQFAVAQKSGGLEISHLVGDYYIYTSYGDFKGTPFPSNGMYILTTEGAVLFDTPWDSLQFQPLLDSIKVKHGKEVVLCISTHFHDDRTAGLEYYKRKGIKTYSSKLTFDLCHDRNENQSQFYFLNDTTFNVGGKAFSTYYAGAGHTSDNIVIWCADEKILYGGCLVKSTETSSLGNLSDANLSEWKKSIKKIIRKYPRPNFVIPGHFAWTDSTALQHTLNLLRKGN